MIEPLEDDAIKNAAENPLSGSADGVNVTGHNLQDLIAADRYTKSQEAVRRGVWGKIRRSRVESPGAT